ncbi:Na+/H+ antiporter [Roseomonas populi]|uniref:Na+/H+ antiporter n=1 Tax=Roseomonas populi TaxID=3121582 RepID=A0ABT1X9L1_9PROT|nr:Na+/H+ antiporter [Roseomonas pecuniae]MCR0984794.1 Na+/H+ antiporter [Roseomonas pecuniae]
MSPTAQFEFILLLLVAVVCLEALARLLRLPPAAALILGGGALTFIPGMPALSLDPELVLLLFLPPLLMASAYFTPWREFRAQLGGILALAVGAVAFTTLAVGLVVRWAVPELPWAACFALGAVVSPPDAVAAKAVLQRVRLPRRTMMLLEGESLLNDAAGIVLFRFAVAAALTGTFSLWDATVSFGVLAIGGIVAGLAVGAAGVRLLGLFKSMELGIITTLLMPWAAYILAEELHASGVIATVVAGMVLGWYQHEIFTAGGRRTGTAVWEIMTHLLEALVFVLIGLSLRGVLLRLGGAGDAAQDLGGPVLAVIVAVILSRFAFVFGARLLMRGLDRLRGHEATGVDARASAVIGWAGMRGVVTLAVALSVPEEMAGRDLILVSAFAVILVTVLLQGTTLGWVIRLLGVGLREDEGGAQLTRHQAEVILAETQLATVQALATALDGSIRHPRLLEQFGYRARAAARFSEASEDLRGARDDHFDVVLAAVAAGRAEVLRLHRAGRLHDEVLHALEHDLDLQELMAGRLRGA